MMFRHLPRNLASDECLILCRERYKMNSGRTAAIEFRPPVDLM